MLSVFVVALGGQGLFRSELSLVRSSVLYADRVLVLTSPSARALRRLTSDIVTDRRGRRLKLPDSLLQSIGRAALERTPEGDVANIVETGAVDLLELQSATKAGLIERIDLVHPDDLSRQLTDEDLIERFVEVLSDPRVHAVFDDKGDTTIAALAQVDGRVSAAAQRTEAELGAGLIARIPAFPQARIDELIDLKTDLVGPLTRYRASVARLESHLDATSTTAQLDEAIDSVWRGEVAPAMVELQDLCVEHSLVRELAKTASTSARDLIISGASLSIALSTVGQIAATASAAAGLAGMAIQMSAKTLVERSAHRRDMQKHDFYYLFRLGQVAQGK